MALTTNTGTGTQGSTQSPQASATAGSFGGQQASSVQSGTAASVLTNNGGGIPLTSSTGQPITLSATATQTQTTVQASPAAAPRHINWGLATVSVIFFVVAVGLFWVTNRSAKTTTKYS